VLAFTDVELAHRRYQPGRARERTEQLGQLRGDTRVFEAGAGDQVVDAPPDLVEAVNARLAAALK
jgi:hypothetical protein